MRKKLFAPLALIAVAAAALVGFTACAPKAAEPTGKYAANKDVYYFGWSHQACIGVAHVITNDNGDLVLAQLDEIFNMSAWTKVSETAKDLIGADNVISYTTTTGSGDGAVMTTTYWAKYVAFNGDVYQASFVESATGAPNVSDTKTETASNNVRYFKVTGSAVSATSLDSEIVADQTLAKKFYDACKTTMAEILTPTGTTSAGIQFAKADKTKISIVRKINKTAAVSAPETASLVYWNAGTASGTGAHTSIFKRESGYGPVNNTGYSTGISGTYNILEQYVIKNGFGFDADTVTVTGATAADTKNYLKLLKGAGDLIKK